MKKSLLLEAIYGGTNVMFFSEDAVKLRSKRESGGRY